jgi:molybdenum cofactor biosynthesis enzyme MoaA
MIEIAANADVRRLRLTGGEPLPRPDIAELVERIASSRVRDAVRYRPCHGRQRTTTSGGGGI